MLVSRFLEDSAARYPDKPAFCQDNRWSSYAELDMGANRVARALADAGLERGDRIGVWLENSLESVLSLFGISKADGIFFVVNPKVKSRKIAYMLNDCRAKGLITDPVRLKRLLPILSECPHLRVIVTTGTDDTETLPVTDPGPRRFMAFREISDLYPSTPLPRKSIDIDLAGLIYTSGSTGLPKAVMMTHGNMASAAESIITYLENTPDDRILNVLPLSFDYGLYQVLMAAKFGGSLVMEQAFLYPYRIVELLQEHKVTGFPLVPTITAILLRMKDLDRHRFPHLRYITNTAQAMPERFVRDMRRIFPETRIYLMYGLTECKRVSYLPPEEIDRRPLSVGKAMPNTEVFLVDTEGRRISESGRIGELIVRGGSVMRGYWGLPEETSRVLEPGPVPGERQLRTGDLFKMDDEGYLYFVGRRDDVLKVGGERVSPKEIEDCLYRLNGVAEAAVVGVEDEILGQAVKAVLVLKDGAGVNEQDVLRHCSEQMEAFLVPKFVCFVKSLPRTAHGKVDRQALAASR